MSHLLIGADPEFWLTQNGKPISATGVVHGTKEKPYHIGNGACQADGCAAEINIMPAGSANMFIHNVNEVLNCMAEMLPQYKFKFTSVMDFGKEYMNSLPDEVKVLGCDPDINPYVAEANPSPEAHPTIRAAGGHIHLGWTSDEDTKSFEHFANCCTVAKQMDFFLGLPSLLLEEDDRRRSMYGKAGAMRVKSYGCEYRPPSNFWLTSRDRMRMMYLNAQEGFKMLEDDKRFLGKEFGMQAAEAINRGDRASAASLCDQIGIKVCA